MRKSLASGILYMVASALSLSLIGLFGQLGLQSLSLKSVLFWRFFCSFLFCLALLYGLKEKITIKYKLIRENLVRALFVLGSQYSFFFYMENNSLLNATALLNTGPFFIPLIAWIFFQQKIDRPTWIGLLVCFIGVLCILQPESSLFCMASLIGLFAGLCQAISQILFGAQSKEQHPVLNTCYLFFFCMIGTLPSYLCSESHWLPKKDFLVLDLFFLIFLGLASVSNQFFRAAAYKKSSPTKLSAFLYFSVLFSGFLDWFVFHKSANLLSFIGAFLIISGGSFKAFFLFRKLKIGS